MKPTYCVVALMVLVSACVARGADPAAAPSAPATRPAAAERAKTAERGFAIAEQLYNKGLGTIEAVCAWSARWTQARQAAGDKRADALKDEVARLTELESNVSSRFNAGVVTEMDMLTVRYARLEAEAAMADEGGK